jgi:hypothetical protein
MSGEKLSGPEALYSLRTAVNGSSGSSGNTGARESGGGHAFKGRFRNRPFQNLDPSHSFAVEKSVPHDSATSHLCSVVEHIGRVQWRVEPGGIPFHPSRVHLVGRGLEPRSAMGSYQA